MRVNVPFEFDDETRARIRAFYGRGGLATRKEIRRFVLDELEQSRKELPEAKRRRAKSPAPAPSTLQQQAEAWSADVVCGNCTKPRGEHKGAKLDCPLSRSIKPGSRFRAIASPAAEAAQS